MTDVPEETSINTKSSRISIVAPTAIITYLLAQGVYLIRWGSHLEDQSVASIQRNEDQDKRISEMDANGTRKLAVIDDRQQSVFIQLNEHRMQLDRLAVEIRELERRMLIK